PTALLIIFRRLASQVQNAGIGDALPAQEPAHEPEERQRLVIADGLHEHGHEDAMRDDDDSLALFGFEHPPRSRHPPAYMGDILRALPIPKQVEAVAVEIEEIAEGRDGEVMAAVERKRPAELADR